MELLSHEHTHPARTHTRTAKFAAKQQTRSWPTSVHPTGGMRGTRREAGGRSQEPSEPAGRQAGWQKQSIKIAPSCRSSALPPLPLPHLPPLLLPTKLNLICFARRTHGSRKAAAAAAEHYVPAIAEAKLNTPQRTHLVAEDLPPRSGGAVEDGYCLTP